MTSLTITLGAMLVRLPVLKLVQSFSDALEGTKSWVRTNDKNSHQKDSIAAPLHWCLQLPKKCPKGEKCLKSTNPLCTFRDIYKDYIKAGKWPGSISRFNLIRSRLLWFFFDNISKIKDCKSVRHIYHEIIFHTLIHDFVYIFRVS